MLARTDPLPDAETLLLLRVARGDRQAFAALARAIARPALGLAVRILGDPALAEDAVQEAMARLWREAGRFDPARGSAGPWWRRIVVNAALDGRRRLRPTQPLDAAAALAGVAGPDAAAEAADLAQQVQQAMQALPARQRAALALFHGEGMTMAEIGAVLGASEKAVEGLLMRGRAALKPALSHLRNEVKR